MCKPLCAAECSRRPSQWRLRIRLAIRSPRVRRRIVLDKPRVAAYCCLHISCPVDHVQARHQDRAPAPGRHAQPPAATGAGRLVPDRRVLRRQRPGAGEVRDASTRAARRRHQGRGCQPVRLVAAHLLPSRGRVRARWRGGLATPAARAEVGPQAHARSNGRDRGAPSQWRPLAGPRNGQGRAQPARRHGAPAQHRAGDGPQKKR